MKTTYYQVTATGAVWRATTQAAREKLRRLAERSPKGFKPLLPKEAKRLIAAKKEYVKIQDII